ncbi:DUF2625 family protein [Anoxybacillus sp. J5B_2022]|uniref:DUF2625 family protein n=1 Tax=Anoxybacillus sp. J5B_2022 TaxID=3003246 RepID=UPI00228656D6|nr:DUF2625 family protein [Anoxybacillus sp. J5B_2022]MCZ0754079.1 DUF2625 family protein [Anoxybacillus sp. J5B_2022]
MKSLNELFDKTESTWKILNEWVENAKNHVELLPVNSKENQKILLELQITTKSLLGTVVYYTGGILVNDGWLRILGSGDSRLPRNLATWNQIENGQSMRLPGSLLVADDVVGGFFAINGGAFEGNIGDVFYLAPDTLEWENLDMSYSDFVNWALTGDVSRFYETFQWENWSDMVRKATGDKGILIYPYLWAEGEEIELRSKSIVPVNELWELNLDNRKKLGLE